MTRTAVLCTLVMLGATTVGITSGCSDPAPEIGADGRPIFTEAQQERLRIHPVSGKEGLYVIPGFDGAMSGGNVAVRVTGDGVILVDNKFPYSYDFITEQIASVTAESIRYVLNTHHHGDHSGSNADFMPEAQVLGHRNARANMIGNDLGGPPPIIYSRQAAVFLGDVEARAYHFGRGHTNGDSVIYFPDLRTIHTGDLFIWGQRIDGSTLSPFMDYRNGGSGAAWAATLDGVLELDFDTVIPGHGPVLTKDDVRTFRNKFEQLTSRMNALIDSDVSRDDIAEQIDIDDLDWPLSGGALQALYDELSAAWALGLAARGESRSRDRHNRSVVLH